MRSDWLNLENQIRKLSKDLDNLSHEYNMLNNLDRLEEFQSSVDKLNILIGIKKKSIEYEGGE